MHRSLPPAPWWCLSTLALALLAVRPIHSEAFEPVVTAHATMGGRWINHSTRHTEGVAEVGGVVQLGAKSWPLIATGHYARTSGQRDTDIETSYEFTTHEVGIGGTRLWGHGSLQPYLAGGWERTTTETRSVDPPDDRVRSRREDGMWLGAGVTYRIVGHVSVGVGGRFKTALTSRDDTPVWSATALLGLGWPALK